MLLFFLLPSIGVLSLLNDSVFMSLRVDFSDFASMKGLRLEGWSKKVEACFSISDEFLGKYSLDF